MASKPTRGRRIGPGAKVLFGLLFVGGMVYASLAWLGRRPVGVDAVVSPVVIPDPPAPVYVINEDGVRTASLDAEVKLDAAVKRSIVILASIRWPGRMNVWSRVLIVAPAEDRVYSTRPSA